MRFHPAIGARCDHPIKVRGPAFTIEIKKIDALPVQKES